MTNIVYLTGFMTCGKSTIGPILANVLGWNFYDLDKVIESNFGMKITEIFELHGEKYFREIETEHLERLSGKKNVVIALGGGAMANDINVNIMNNAGKIIYLKIEPLTVYGRIKNKIDRPIFKDLVLGEQSKEVFLEKIQNMMKARETFYSKADLIIHADNQAVGKVVDEIANKLKKILNENS